MTDPLTILDGPLGSELLARGVPTPLPGWSAHAIDEAPEVVSAIHEEYARAGATVHTTNTFRTRRDLFGERWKLLAARAVALARAAVPAEHQVAGSIAPLADCYHPESSPWHRDPDATRARHEELARVLVEGGCDVLLCETFPLVEEGLVALEASLATGARCWISFTAGPVGGLLTPDEIVSGAREAVRCGAEAVLVNCVPARDMVRFLEPLIDAIAGEVLVGAYGNAGRVDDGMGWHARAEPDGPRRYADCARTWVDLGASIVGGCCGTGPAHIEALAHI